MCLRLLLIVKLCSPLAREITAFDEQLCTNSDLFFESCTNPHYYFKRILGDGRFEPGWIDLFELIWA